MEKVIWKHNGDTTATIEVAQKPIKAKVFFTEHCIEINGVTIPIETLKQIVSNWEINSKAASDMMKPPF